MTTATTTDADWYLRVPQEEVRLLPSVPCVLPREEEEGHGGGTTPTTTAAGAGRRYSLLPDLARHPEMQRVFRPYLETRPEEDQMAIALRLEMEHMRDIFILDRTIGYSKWAKAHPDAHRSIQAAKPPCQRLVLPPRLDDILDMMPGGAGGGGAAGGRDDEDEDDFDDDDSSSSD